MDKRIFTLCKEQEPERYRALVDACQFGQEFDGIRVMSWSESYDAGRTIGTFTVYRRD